MNNQIIASVPEQPERFLDFFVQIYFFQVINQQYKNLKNPSSESSLNPSVNVFISKSCFLIMNNIITLDKLILHCQILRKDQKCLLNQRKIKGKKHLQLTLMKHLCTVLFNKSSPQIFNFNFPWKELNTLSMQKCVQELFRFLKKWRNIMSQSYSQLAFQKYGEILKYPIPQYADPVIDFIDPEHLVSLRLFRENCTVINNIFVKDLSSLNRNIKNIIIIDVIIGEQSTLLTLLCCSLQMLFIFIITIVIPAIKNLAFLHPLQFYQMMQLQFFPNFQFYDIRPVHEWWYKYVHFDKFVYTNTKGERVIYENQISQQDISEEKISEVSVTESNRNRESEEKIISPKMNDIQKLLAIRKRYNPQQTIQKMNSVNNRSGAINSNVEFNVELDEKLLRISTEGGEVVRQSSKSKGDEETDIESEIRHQLNINSPHGVETTTRKLFLSAKTGKKEITE